MTVKCDHRYLVGVLVANFALERSGHRVLVDAVSTHRWMSKGTRYLDLMLEGEQVGEMRQKLGLQPHHQLRIPVNIAFDFEDQQYTSTGELTLLDDRRALVSLIDPTLTSTSRGYLSG